MQKVLDVPYLKAGPLYYSRKLVKYNLTIYELTSKECSCITWSEVDGGRGCCEIGTALLKHFQSMPQRTTEVILFSDTCSGQNKNQYLSLTALLHNYLQSDTTILTITQKFLEPGHTQMECDSVHATIERAKKGVDVFVPSDWNIVMALARRRNPYTVIPLDNKEILNIKAFVNDNNLNLKVFENGEKVAWKKIKVIRAQKGSNTLQILYEYGQEDPFLLNIRQKKRTRKNLSATETIENVTYTLLSTKYADLLPVSDAKKKDLLALCKSSIIPHHHHQFYENLRTSKQLERLPEPDCTEPNCDTDGE